MRENDIPQLPKRKEAAMQITLDIPKHYLTDATPAEFGKSIKLYAALAMFRAGKLSAGAAAEFAEIDRFRFAEKCRKHRIPLINYPPEDLRAELQ
jgi:predicted HTH domain antitoxin